MSIKSEVQRIKNGKILLKDEFAVNDVFIPDDVLINNYYEYLEYLKGDSNGGVIHDCSYLFKDGVRTGEIENVLKCCEPTICYSMFYNCGSQFNQTLIQTCDYSNCTNFARMFEQASIKGENGLAQDLILDGMDTSSATTMEYMFFNCKSEIIDMTSFDTKNITNMLSMFTGSSIGVKHIYGFSCEGAPHAATGSTTIFSNNINTIYWKPGTGFGTHSTMESLTLDLNLISLGVASIRNIIENIGENTTGLERIILVRRPVFNQLTSTEKETMANKGYTMVDVF